VVDFVTFSGGFNVELVRPEVPASGSGRWVQGPGLRRQIDRAPLGFNHILLCAPNEFPVEEQTDLQAEFRKLLDYLGDILSKFGIHPRESGSSYRSPRLKRMLAAYLAGDDKKGSGLIQAAEGHFKGYLEGRKVKPRSSRPWRQVEEVKSPPGAGC
jgi:hypothetical protein